VGDEVYGISEFRRGIGEEGFVSALSLVGGGKDEASGDGIDGDLRSEASGTNKGRRNGESSWERSQRDNVNRLTMLHENEKTEDNTQELHSASSPVEESDIDLSRVHTIWSLSKDLGCSGLRIVCPLSHLVPLAHPYSLFIGDTHLPTQQPPSNRSATSLHPAALLP